VDARQDQDQVAAYELTARRWSTQSNSAARNATFIRNHAAFKAIRASEDGQTAIRRLATDPDETLAGLAATHALWFDPEFGSRILARIATVNSEAGLSAEWTLRELSRGTWNLDW
jgi:hypothetical protein